MKIQKADLIQALERVRPGLANREFIAQTTNFAFLEGNVVTFNNEISISSPVPNLNITGAVQATELYQLLKKLKKDEIEITLKGNELHITSGKVKAGLTLESEIKLPLSEVERKSKWKPLPEGFKEALKFAYTSCSKDLSKPVLMCVHVNKTGFVEGCDNYRVARYSFKEEFPVDTFLIPQSSVVEVLKIDPVKVALDKGWVHFLTEDKTTMSCRVLDSETYPETTKLLGITGTPVLIPEGMAEVLDRAAVFAKRDSAMAEDVTVIVEKGRVVVESKSDTGWFKEEVASGYEGADLKFDVTPTLMRGIVEQTGQFEHCGKMLKFGGDNWVYVASLRG